MVLIKHFQIPALSKNLTASSIELGAGWDIRKLPFDKRDVSLSFYMDKGPGGPMLYNQLHDGHWDSDQYGMSQTKLQKLLGTGWTAESKLEFAIIHVKNNDDLDLQTMIQISFSCNRNWGAWVSNVILPVMCCVALGYSSHFLPSAMAMPRIAISLLAMVSITGMYNAMNAMIPPGMVTILNALLLGAMYCIVFITVAHCHVLSTDDKARQKLVHPDVPENEVRIQNTNTCRGTCTYDQSTISHDLAY